jgi:hypothetical protein
MVAAISGAPCAPSGEKLADVEAAEEGGVQAAAAGCFPDLQFENSAALALAACVHGFMPTLLLQPFVSYASVILGSIAMGVIPPP